MTASRLAALHGPFKLRVAVASHVGWWILTICGLIIFVVGLIVSGPWAARTARTTAERLGHAEVI